MLILAAIATAFLAAGIVYVIEINADLRFHKYGGREHPRLKRNCRICWSAFLIFCIATIIAAA